MVASFTIFFAPSPAFPDGQLDPAASPRLSAAVAVAILAVVWTSAAGTHRRIPHLPRRSAGPSSPPLRLATWWTDLRRAIANGSFRAVFLASSVYSVSRGVQLALGMHVLTPVALRLLGWFPATADPWTLRLVVLCNVIAGLGGGAALVANGSMLADISDQHELEHGVRQEGAFFGAEGLAEKTSSGVGLLLAGFAIDLIRFPAEAVSSGVAPGIVARLGIVYGPSLLISAGLSTVFLRSYGIDRERHRAILRGLAAKRAGTVPAAVEADPRSEAAASAAAV